MGGMDSRVLVGIRLYCKLYNIDLLTHLYEYSYP